MTNKIVSVSYNDLLSDKDLTNTIGQAYGQDGLGIILITDYPNLGDKKNKLLRLSQIFAFLPEGVPTLESRLKDVRLYRDFVNNTINAYYNS
jgi:hypothetical protein